MASQPATPALPPAGLCRRSMRSTLPNTTEATAHDAGMAQHDVGAGKIADQILFIGEFLFQVAGAGSSFWAWASTVGSRRSVGQQQGMHDNGVHGWHDHALTVVEPSGICQSGDRPPPVSGRRSCGAPGCNRRWRRSPDLLAVILKDRIRPRGDGRGGHPTSGPPVKAHGVQVVVEVQLGKQPGDANGTGLGAKCRVSTDDSLFGRVKLDGDARPH